MKERGIERAMDRESEGDASDRREAERESIILGKGGHLFLSCALRTNERERVRVQMKE